MCPIRVGRYGTRNSTAIAHRCHFRLSNGLVRPFLCRSGAFRTRRDAAWPRSAFAAPLLGRLYARFNVLVFDRIGADDYEQVVFCHDRPTGLRAVVAIHSTVLGPALGGTRYYPYATEDDAVEDVLRLAKGMTYKSAAAGLDLGGGKAVITGDPAKDKTEALMRAYARFVDTLGRRYITAEDVGTTQADMDVIRRETANVTGVSRALGRPGDPSAATAYGVHHAMKAVVKVLCGAATLSDRHVVVSGVGK